MFVYGNVITTVYVAIYYKDLNGILRIGKGLTKNIMNAFVALKG